jgi:hypothetical protein
MNKRHAPLWYHRLRRAFVAGVLTYVPRGTRLPVGAKIHVGRDGIAASAGIRNVGGACFYLSRTVG